MAVIDRNAKAQTQIIEDILDMSRIISGKLRLDVQPADVAQLVRAGVGTVQPSADAKGVRLAVVVDAHAGPVMGDANRLHQVFWNLLSNAVKFTPRGGQVQVAVRRVEDRVEVSVSDTGDGIAPEFLPHVFDRFRQADASTTRRHGGLGLGLSIVRQLIDMHGGTVQVKSAGKGRGASFIVTLPIMLLEATTADQSHDTAVTKELVQKTHEAARLQLAGVNILAIDDEPDGRSMLHRLLGECGAVVQTAGSAAEAIAAFDTCRPAVIVSDIGMPGEDGYSLIRRIRSRPAVAGGQVPAIALTAYARANDRIRAIEAGFQAHLVKPVNPAELIITVAAMANLAGKLGA
ncbi:MAG: ATP-binding protein [Tepidisphaeraceae bacterium]